jgi:hypothetical protein
VVRLGADTQRVVTDWLDARAGEGWLVNYGDVDVSGFPTHFRTGFEALELADPDTGWLWTMPTLTLESRALDPDHIRADWPAEQGLASPGERLTIEAAEMTSELDVKPRAGFRARRLRHGACRCHHRQRRGLADEPSGGTAQHDAAGGGRGALRRELCRP